MFSRTFKTKTVVTSLCFIFAFISINIIPPVTVAAYNNNKITIYHTNDIHGKVNSTYSGEELTQIGLDIIKGAKDETPNSILIDAGDATQGVPLGKFSKGMAMIELMNAAGYDGMTLGNHEFDYGVSSVFNLAKMAKFPIVSANTCLNGSVFLNGVNGNNGCNFIKEIGGKKIGFFGITTEETTRTTIPENLEGITFKDELQTAKEQVSELKKQDVDLIVGVMHVGIDSSSKITSRQIAKEISDIDIIIDGHSHNKSSETINNTIIQQTGTADLNLGKIEVDFSGGKPKISSELITAKEAGKTFKADENVSAIYNKFANEISPILEKVVGRTKNTLYGGSYSGKNVSRMVETNLGSLICDGMISDSKSLLKGTDFEEFPIVALENGGAVRSRIDSGFINMEDVYQVLPLDNKLSIQCITPSILYQTIERGVCKQNNPPSISDPIDGFFGGYPQISGVRFEYDISKNPYNTDNPQDFIGERVAKIILLNDDGSDAQELDRNDTSTKIMLACNDYTVTEYPMIKDIPIEIKGDYLSAVLANHINKLTIKSNGNFTYPLKQNRSLLLKDSSLFGEYSAKITVINGNEDLSNKYIKVKVDNNEPFETLLNINNSFSIDNLSSGGHTVCVFNGEDYNDAYIDETVGLKTARITLGTKEPKNIKSTINIINQIPVTVSEIDSNLIMFARASYDSLSDDAKAQISNYNTLVNAENSLNNSLESSESSIALASYSTHDILVIISCIIASVAVLIIILMVRKKRVKEDR